jgi:exosortase D (VPLPA-CTERM-specific)
MVHKIKFRSVLQVTLVAALALFLVHFYWPVLVSLANSLTASEDYSFGLLLPFVSGYLVYLKWPRLRRHGWQPSWMGLPIIFLGFGIYMLGDLAAAFYFPPVSFLVVLTGLLWLTGGWPLVRELAFPLLLLLLMIPLPSMVMQSVTFPLQLLSSSLAASMLQFIGIPVVRHGNVIDMGVRQLQVVDACSGLRYILSLSSLGLIYCYFYQSRLWKAAILVLCLVPSAILANALRVATMGIFPALQEGFWHSFSGWLIFIFCFGFLILINWLLNYLKPEVSIPDAEAKFLPEGAEPASATKTSYLPHLIAALILVLLAGQMALRLSRAPDIPLLQALDNFPLTLGDYQGSRDYLDAAMAKTVGADAYLDVNYTSPQSASVNLWMAYFERQSKKVEGRIHSPLICLSGSGWRFLESKIVDVAPGLPVRYLLIERGGSRELVYYWYLQQGNWVASEYSSRLFMGWNGLVKHRNDGAIVRLITPVQPNIEAAQDRLNKFVHLLVPLLPKYFRE